MAELMPTIIDEVTDTRETPSRTYYIDFEKGRVYGMVDGIEAVRQAAYKAIITPRFGSPLYNNQYGSELFALFKRGNTTPALIESEVPRIIRDALSPDTRILDVYDFEIEQENDVCTIGFTMDTVFGTTKMGVTA